VVGDFKEYASFFENANAISDPIKAQQGKGL
jgi:hypothetical protein